jgi:uncharacterized protein (DUF58 family)
MIKVRATFWVVFILTILSVFGYIWTRSSFFVNSSVLGLLLVLLSLILSKLSVLGLTFKRTSREQRLELGRILEERIEVVNHGRFRKPWLEVRDQSVFPGASSSRVLSKIGRGELRNYSSYSNLRTRGNYKLGPTKLVAGDPFGLFQAEVEFEATSSVLVLPFITDIRWFPFPPGYLQGGRIFRQKTLEVTPHAAGVREYVSGDSLNRIHWPSTARREQLMVKEFEKDPQTDAWIMVDAQRGTHNCIKHPEENNKEKFWFWKTSGDFKLPDDSFEYAVSLAASVTKYFIRNDQAIGFCSAGQRYISLPAERGERQLGKVLEALAYLDCKGRMPLYALVESQAPHLSRGSTVVIITASASQHIALAAETLLRRSLKPIFILIDPESFEMEGDSDRLLKLMRSRKVPVALVRCKDQLSDALENGFQ